MATEFRGEEFPGTQFPTGEDVLEFYEIEDTNRGNDVSACLILNPQTYLILLDLTNKSFFHVLQMVVLLFYGLILHLFSFVVLHIRHSWFRGSISPSDKKVDTGGGSSNQGSV